MCKKVLNFFLGALLIQRTDKIMIENKGFSIKTTELVDVLGWFHRLRYNSVSLVWALTSYSRKA